MIKKIIFFISLILLIIVGTLFLYKGYFEKIYFYFQEKERNITKQNENVLKNNQTQNSQIMIFSPKKYEKVKSPLKVIGQAKGSWFFEATFPVILTDWDGKIIAESYAQAKGDWMTTNFVEFEGVLEFKSPVFDNASENHFSRKGYLIFKKNNPSGLLEYDDSIEIPIIFDF